MAGSARSRRKPSAKASRLAAPAAVLTLLFVGAGSAEPPAIVPYEVVGDGIPASLTGNPGDAARGRAIVVNRQLGLCLLCHSGPFPEERLQGTLAPSLAGAGSRNSLWQLRLRIVDASRVNPSTIMPPYYRTAGLTRVAQAYINKPILTAEQIEDVVAFLAMLKE
jgi:sulfur-oxidizing protein SoxX